MAWVASDPERARRLADAALMARSLSIYAKKAWEIIEPGTPYIPGWHNDCIYEHLEAVTAGQIRRLIINMPPRYGKSNNVSVIWPTWEWITYPAQRWLFLSYAIRLSQDHSTARRMLIESQWYQSLWGDRYQLAPDQNSKFEYHNTYRGKMYATVIGGQAHGGGGNRIVIDDPHDPDEADSDTERGKANRYFRKTIYTRQDNKAVAAIVIVMQRLHEDDMTGEQLKTGEWVHLKLPGEARGRTVVRFPVSGRTIVREDGEPLCEARENRAQLAAAKRNMTPYVYAAQYDQEPAPPGGGMFKREWFTSRHFVTGRPLGARWVRYWDKAGTSGGKGARTAGCLMGRDLENRFYIASIVKGRWSAGDRERIIRETAEMDTMEVDIWMEQEGGHSGMEAAESSIINLVGFNARRERVSGEKDVRAGPFAAQCEIGNVYFIVDKGPDGVADTVWVEEFLGEACLFPNCTLKDQVDAASGAFNKLALTPVGGNASVSGDRQNYSQGLVGQGPGPMPVPAWLRGPQSPIMTGRSPNVAGYRGIGTSRPWPWPKT